MTADKSVVKAGEAGAIVMDVGVVGSLLTEVSI